MSNLRRALSLIVVVAALAASSARADWAPPKPAEWIALAAVEGLIVVDTLQTRRIIHDGGGEVQPAARWLMGSNPDAARVYAVGAIGGAVTACLFYVLPSPWRDLFLAGVGGAEVGVIASNSGFALRLRF